MEDLLGKMQELLSDPESMKQISELAQMLKTDSDASASVPPETTVSNTDGFDPSVLLKAGNLLNQEPDKNINLLLALRPHLRSARQEKLDRAVKLLKLWNLWKQMKNSGMLRNLL